MFLDNISHQLYKLCISQLRNQHFFPELLASKELICLVAGRRMTFLVFAPHSPISSPIAIYPITQLTHYAVDV